MELLIPHTDLQPRKNHVFVDELIVKIQRFKECFPWGVLPLPSAKSIAAWNDLPNVTMKNLYMTGLVLLQAPPTTPTGLTFDMPGPASSDLSPNGDHDDGGWLVVDDATSDTSDAVIVYSTTSEDDSVSRCSHPESSLDQQINEDPFQSSSSSSSDQGSLSSSAGGSPIPVGFHNMVNQWLLDYRTRGTDAFIESFIAHGAISVGTASQASRIARAMVKKVAKVSYMEGRNLEHAVRLAALAGFRKCWELNDTDISMGVSYTTPPSPYAINIASFMGSLFDEKICSEQDIHLCLALLLKGEKRFDRLCAMHALLVQANDKLCKNRHLPPLMQFRDGITCIEKASGEYLWATTPRSKVILMDILGLIERWMVSQAIKREKSRMSSGTGHRTIRNSAVGPRLRN